tara:strand:- start:8370 stop:8741 length:372 start_codon:yes stop_codon:yes gene_type:complete
MSIDIPEDVLSEVRFQAETIFRLALYKRPEFNFLHSLGIRHIFETITDKEYGFLGILYLKYTVDVDYTLYWKSHWFDKANEAVELAEKLQDEKIINEDKIVDYQQHYIDMIYGRKNTGIILLS